MDEIRQLKLLMAAVVLTLAALVLGIELGVMWFRERRERRRSTLLDHVSRRLASDELRRRVGISVRGALLARKRVVTLDMRACSRDEVWETTTCLSRDLGPGVRLVVLGALDRQPGAAFRLETRKGLAQPEPAPAPGC
ncbi:MAG: hypothetical protein HY613_02695 [Candidatus Rokubacteria bacterium]|nr:hypothetical protein [Candidatus Rokubacteria bacterium]